MIGICINYTRYQISHAVSHRKACIVRELEYSIEDGVELLRSPYRRDDVEGAVAILFCNIVCLSHSGCLGNFLLLTQASFREFRGSLTSF